MARQAIGPSIMFPVFINETVTAQIISVGGYINETSGVVALSARGTAQAKASALSSFGAVLQARATAMAKGLASAAYKQMADYIYFARRRVRR